MGIIIAVLLFSFIIIFHELGHFLLAKKNGVLERNGHTEATVDLMRLAGLKECGLFSETASFRRRVYDGRR